MPPRVLLVDDNRRYAEIATRTLTRDGLPVVAVASDTATALAAAETSDADVVLVDISLGPESGVDACRQLLAAHPRLAGRIVLMSTRDEDEVVELVELAGAAGFLDKAALSADAVRAVLTG